MFYAYAALRAELQGVSSDAHTQNVATEYGMLTSIDQMSLVHYAAIQAKEQLLPTWGPGFGPGLGKYASTSPTAVSCLHSLTLAVSAGKS